MFNQHINENWDSQKTINQRKKEHNYTKIVKKNNAFIDGGKVTVMERDVYWKEDFNFLFVKDLRIAGKEQDILSFLEFIGMDSFEIDELFDSFYRKCLSPEYKPLVYTELMKEVSDCIKFNK